MKNIPIEGESVQIGFKDGLYVSFSDTYHDGKVEHIDRDAFIALLAKEFKTTSENIEIQVSNYI
ncbi:hypothetical protein CWS43_18590 [Rahnella sp. AA]|uniref:hypothetical protein n=1 Tax=Rahnella sp. AA TaxID=2057180 RepID=UPI000C32AA1C|nr:hypothetical protein [Rahnella sp. AA]PKE28863.1 hypothetical protein CWS43_18590 [Rahnella sp. AA]